MIIKKILLYFIQIRHTDDFPSTTSIIYVVRLTRMKMGESRRLPLRAWLEGILNEGRVPGVEWLDKDTRTFKIPWKRNISDQSSRSDDLQIFLVS